VPRVSRGGRAVHKLESDSCPIGIKPPLDVGTQGISDDYTGRYSGSGIGNSFRINYDVPGAADALFAYLTMLRLGNATVIVA